MPAEQPPTPESSDSEPIDLPPIELPPEPEFEPEQAAKPADESSVKPPFPIAPSSTAESQTLQTLQEFWQTTQPKLKAGTIKVLKTTIQVLEGAVTRLEAEPRAESPATQPSSQPSTQPLNRLGASLQRIWQRFWSWWNGVLPKIGSILPTAVNEALSDQVLTGAIAGILVLVLWTGSSIFSRQPPQPVAVVPPSQSTPAKPTPTQEKKEPKSKNVPAVKVAPPQPTPQSAPKQPAVDSAKTPPTPITKPSPVASPTPSPPPSPPTPPLKLTPEQTLIARIQDQVAEVSDRYVNGLIQSVQANFRSSRLTVKVGDGWYSLLPAQQDSLANDILKRAQQLNFIKLEVTDTKGALLARSPVIGSEMIVLQRSM